MQARTHCLAWLALSLASFVLLCAISTAVARPSVDWRRCHDLKASTSETIRGCTALIEKREGTSKELAVDYYNRGNSYLATKQYDKAIGDFTEAIRLDSPFARAFNNRGVAYVSKKKFDRAIEDYNQAIRINPKYAQALVGRGFVYFLKGDYDHALADYNRAGELDASGLVVGIDRAMLYSNKRNYELAISDYNLVLKSDPRSAAALYGRGLAKIQLGDIKGGSKDVSAAKLIDSTIADQMERLGFVAPQRQQR